MSTDFWIMSAIAAVLFWVGHTTNLEKMALEKKVKELEGEANRYAGEALLLSATLDKLAKGWDQHHLPEAQADYIRARILEDARQDGAPGKFPASPTTGTDQPD